MWYFVMVLIAGDGHVKIAQVISDRVFQSVGLSELHLGGPFPKGRVCVVDDDIERDTGIELFLDVCEVFPQTSLVGIAGVFGVVLIDAVNYVAVVCRADSDGHFGGIEELARPGGLSARRKASKNVNHVIPFRVRWFVG
jgi:hypothetical protein